MTVTPAYQQYVPRAGNLDPVGDSQPVPAGRLPAATTSVQGAMSAADKTKLGTIATGATVNSSDAALLARANHTGTQAIGTVSGLQASLDGKLPASSASAAADANTVALRDQFAALYASSFHGDGSGLGGLTPGQVGADASGAAAAVSSALSTHTARTDNPHSTTLAQAAAVPGGPLPFDTVLMTTASQVVTGTWATLAELSVTLPAGSYVVMARARANQGSAGYARIRVRNVTDGADLSPPTILYDAAGTDTHFGHLVTAIFTLAGTRSVAVQVDCPSGAVTVYSDDNGRSYLQWLRIG